MSEESCFYDATLRYNKTMGGVYLKNKLGTERFFREDDYVFDVTVRPRRKKFEVGDGALTKYGRRLTILAFHEPTNTVWALDHSEKNPGTYYTTDLTLVD